MIIAEKSKNIDTLKSEDAKESTENKEIERLVNIINYAANTYKEISSTQLNENVEYFIKMLARQHKGFVQKAFGKNGNSNGFAVKNQLKPDATFNKESAIDLLLLCIDIEKQILDQAREAVHNANGERKQMLCKQLTFSEKAIFEADQMLEEYE